MFIPSKPLTGVKSAVTQGILYSNGHLVGGRDLSRLGRRDLASVVPPCLSPGPLDPKVGAPRTLLAIHSVHGVLGLFNAAEVDKKVVVVTGFESLGGVRSKQLANVLTKVKNKGQHSTGFLCDTRNGIYVHLEILEEIVDVDAQSFVVGQFGKTTDIQAAAGVTVHFGESGGFIFPPAVDGEWRILLSVHALLLRLHNTGLDLDGATKHVMAVQFAHCPISELLCRQVNETVGWVAARERIDRNVDTLAMKHSVWDHS